MSLRHSACYTRTVRHRHDLLLAIGMVLPGLVAGQSTTTCVPRAVVGRSATDGGDGDRLRRPNSARHWKEDMAALIVQHLAGERLRTAWEGLDDVQRAAVAEAGVTAGIEKGLEDSPVSGFCQAVQEPERTRFPSSYRPSSVTALVRYPEGFPIRHRD